MTAAAAGLARFGRVQVEMLECVYQHRLLSTAQLHALYRDGLSLRRTQRALGAMERVGWLASVRQPGGMKLWFVTEAGADAVEAIGNRAEPRRKLIPPEQAAGPLQQHTLAVNEVGVAFVRAARERGDEFGPLAWRNEIAHPLGSTSGPRGLSAAGIADAVLSYEEYTPQTVYTHLRFLELDRATMATETLVAKLGRYVDLHNYIAPPSKHRGAKRLTGSPRWREHYPHFPAVMVVLANAPRLRLQRRGLQTWARWKHRYAARAPDIDLYICLLEDLIEQGPFAAIFKSSVADGLVNWLGDPPPEPDETEEEAEPATDDDEAPPWEPEAEPPEPDAEIQPVGVDEEYDDVDMAPPAEWRAPPVAYGRLLPFPGSEPADDERDPWERQ